MPFPIIATALGLAEFVPSIAKLLGSNPENTDNIAHQIVEVAKKVTGIDHHEDIAKTLRENALLIRDFQKEVVRIEADIELEIIKDKQSARERDIAIAQMGRKNTRADVMVISAAAGLVGCLYTLTYYAGSLPGEAVGIISTIAGIFGACLKDAYAFEFGSSRGSREKDSMVAIMGKY